MFRAVSLIAWYADSPPTANHGMRLANCTDRSLACLTAGQNALNELHQRQGKEHVTETQELRSETVKYAKSEEQHEQFTPTPLYELSFLGTFNESVKINISIDGRQMYMLDVKPKQLGALDLSFLPGMAAVLARENNTVKKVSAIDTPGTGDRNASGESTEGKPTRVHVRDDLRRWSLLLLSVCTMLYYCCSHRKSLRRWCRSGSDENEQQNPASRYRNTLARALKNAGSVKSGGRGHANRRLPVNRYRDILAKGVGNTGIVANVDGETDLEGEWESE